MTLAQLELRVAMLEAEVARLKPYALGGSREAQLPIDTLAAIHGAFENDRAFKTAMKLGRAWRNDRGRATPPKKRSREGKAKSR